MGGKRPSAMASVRLIVPLQFLSAIDRLDVLRLALFWSGEISGGVFPRSATILHNSTSLASSFSLIAPTLSSASLLWPWSNSCLSLMFSSRNVMFSESSLEVSASKVLIRSDCVEFALMTS